MYKIVLTMGPISSWNDHENFVRARSDRASASAAASSLVMDYIDLYLCHSDQAAASAAAAAASLAMTLGIALGPI